jgi:hypothetical protein
MNLRLERVNPPSGHRISVTIMICAIPTPPLNEVRAEDVSRLLVYVPYQLDLLRKKNSCE